MLITHQNEHTRKQHSDFVWICRILKFHLILAHSCPTCFLIWPHHGAWGCGWCHTHSFWWCESILPINNGSNKPRNIEMWQESQARIRLASEHWHRQRMHQNILKDGFAKILWGRKCIHFVYWTSGFTQSTLIRNNECRFNCFTVWLVLRPVLFMLYFMTVCLVQRFLFLLLGPHGKGPQYHEIGRSMATLMTDEVRERKMDPFCYFSLP